MSDVFAASFLPDLICVHLACFLALITIQAHAKHNPRTIHISGNITRVAATVMHIFHKSFTESSCYSFKPTFWGVPPGCFGFFRDCEHQKQEDKGSNVTEFHCTRSCRKQFIETTFNILWRSIAFT